MNNKYLKYLVLLVSILLIKEGLDGEFTSPSVFDYIKWIAYIFMIATYLVYVIKVRRK